MRNVYIDACSFEKMKKLTIEYPHYENGGLLFGRMNPEWIRIYDVSDAGQNAIRTKYGVTFDSSYLQQYTEERLKEDIFVIGTWHSHPAPYGLDPSPIDISVAARVNRPKADGIACP